MTQLRGKLVYTNLRLFPFLSISADYGASIGTSILGELIAIHLWGSNRIGTDSVAKRSPRSTRRAFSETSKNVGVVEE